MASPTSSSAQQTPSSEPAFNVYTNPYKAKNPWPPDFEKLSDKHQFRLERRYKRRAQLKWARPNWMIATRLAQYGLSIGVATYAVLFMDWGEGNERAFEGIRGWYKEQVASIWSNAPPQRPSMSAQNRTV